MEKQIELLKIYHLIEELDKKIYDLMNESPETEQYSEQYSIQLGSLWYDICERYNYDPYGPK